MADHTNTTVGGATQVAPPAGAPSPDPSRVARSVAPRLTFRQRLSQWDVRFSPYLYIAPFFIVFIAIGLYPMIYSGYLSFFEWKPFTSHHGDFVGWHNYVKTLQDPVFRTALTNTVAIFLLSSVPQIVVATVIAALLDTSLRARTWWRMSILLPFVVAPAAVALIFGSLFSDTGLVNEVIGHLGIGAIKWHDAEWHGHGVPSWIAIASMVNYRWTGYNTLIILAAMQAVPRDTYEAAAIDGATKVQQFLHITVPSIRPTMLFVIITSTIGGMQIFTEPHLFDTNLQGQGGANYQYQTLTMYVYNHIGSPYNNYTWAAAASWIVFIIIIAVAMLNFFITRAIQGRGAK